MVWIARSIAVSRSVPVAKYAAIQVDSVHPVPWVLRLAIRGCDHVRVVVSARMR